MHIQPGIRVPFVLNVNSERRRQLWVFRGKHEVEGHRGTGRREGVQLFSLIHAAAESDDIPHVSATLKGHCAV